MSSQKSKQFPTTIGAERGTFKQSFTQATLNSKLNPATIKVLCPAMLRHPEFMFKRGKKKKKKSSSPPYDADRNASREKKLS